MEKHAFEVDRTVFPRTVLLRVCHAFLDRCPVELESGDEKHWHVSFHLDERSLQKKEALEGEFRNSLVNEAFRDALMERAQVTKELIVAKALFGVEGNIAPSSEATPEGVQPLPRLDAQLDDYEADPLGIAVPWEEKYGSSKSSSDSQTAEGEAEKCEETNS